MSEINTYHSLAKDAGNRLRSYILSVASGAAGVFFLALTKSEAGKFTSCEKWLLLIALIGFVLTVGLCLYELRIDAQRFFSLAKELEKPEQERVWTENESFKTKRYRLIHASYVTLSFGVISTSIYLILKIFST